MPNSPLVNLRPHQRLMCDFVKSHPACGLFADMGAGKTLTVLEALYELGEPGHVLVIGPKPTVRSTWPSEVRKFGFPFRTGSLTSDERGKALTPAARADLLGDIVSGRVPPTLWMVNREMVVRVVEALPMQGKARVWPFSTVIIDESQSFKSRNSKRVKALSDMRPAMNRVIELSGTPTPNGMEDLWAQVYLLDGGIRLGRYITHFREKYFLPDMRVRTPQGYPARWVIKPGAEQFIYDKVSDIVMSMRDVSPLMPPVIIDVVNIMMSDAAWKLYNELARDSVLEFGSGPDDEVVAANAAVLQAKLLQMASGALYLDQVPGASPSAERGYVVIHEDKLDMLSEIVAQASGPVLVAYWFRSDKEMIMRRMERDHVDASVFDGSPEMVDSWNAGDIPVMLVQPASAGHGLNLQFGGHVLVWYTMPWSLEHYLQTNARLARPGQTMPTIIHILSMEGTVDEKVADALAKKQLSQDDFLDAISYARSKVFP